MASRGPVLERVDYVRPRIHRKRDGNKALGTILPFLKISNGSSSVIKEKRKKEKRKKRSEKLGSRRIGITRATDRENSSIARVHEKTNI